MKKQVLSERKIERVEISKKDYNLLATMPMNRPVTQAGVNRMSVSIRRNGVLRDVIVVWDSKKNKYYIIDGQHLVVAIKKDEGTIPCRVVECKSEAEITQLMIDLNNISKSWNLQDYIHGWKESGIKDYRILENAKDVMYADVQLSIIIQAYTQQGRHKSNKMVREGTFRILDKEKGDFYIDCISSLTYYLPNTRQVNEALIKLMLVEKKYDHKKMVKNIKEALKGNVSFNVKKESDLFKLFKDVYRGTLKDKKVKQNIKVSLKGSIVTA